MNERDSEQVARTFVEGGYTLTREEAERGCDFDQYLQCAGSGGAEGFGEDGDDGEVS